MTNTYNVQRAAQSHHIVLRGLNYHFWSWGDASLAADPATPPLVMVHGWMDVGASYQFLVDELARIEGPRRWIIAPDWRGFGLTDAPKADSYWFPDYLADLDALLDTVMPTTLFPAIDLVGHSMGGNVVMSYAGLRPGRIHRLVNLEGFGLPRSQPHQAPKRLLQWLDGLKEPQTLRSYDSVQEVATRLQKNNPLLSAEKAAWLAPHWSRQRADGRWHILGDPAHKLVNPVLYQVEEVLATWKLITAPVLWAEGDRTDIGKWWGNRYTKAEFHERLATVAHVEKLLLSPCGHMLHHDQPGALAARLATFLAP